MIDKHLSTDTNKVDILKSKVYLASRLLDDKHEENTETQADLVARRQKFTSAEGEYFTMKQKMSKLRTSKNHFNIDIDHAARKT